MNGREATYIAITVVYCVVVANHYCLWVHSTHERVRINLSKKRLAVAALTPFSYLYDSFSKAVNCCVDVENLEASHQYHLKNFPLPSFSNYVL